MYLRPRFLAQFVLIVLMPLTLSAQSFRSADTVIRRIWEQGMEHSQVEHLAQVLTDSIGPRLSGSPGFQSAGDFLERTYRAWGVTARRERYGTWRGWQQGVVHLDMIAPRVVTLEGRLLAWSPGTSGKSVDGDVVVVPELPDEAAAQRFLASVRGKFVLARPPEPMCRAPQELEKNARASTVAKLRDQRAEVQRTSLARLRSLGASGASDPIRSAYARLDSAGVAGILTLTWSGGWGVNKVFGAVADHVPSLDVSCEDYGMLYRLASNNQGPRVRLFAESQATPSEVPMFNLIAELPGRELPNEYVMLSAHLDSWHGAQGATDNGTGTVMMMEAMRLLKDAYPHPRRTILVGHWGGEEQGENGSLAFGEDHPEVLSGLQALFNQDNGTWRIEYLEASGFLTAGANLARWVSQLPADLTDSIKFSVPGAQMNMGSDHSAFICKGAPGFRLQSSYPEYRQYTWHTNRDTYDKIVFDDLKQNATTAAMLVYAASEDRDRVARDASMLPVGPDGKPRPWVRCGKARRSFAP